VLPKVPLRCVLAVLACAPVLAAARPAAALGAATVAVTVGADPVAGLPDAIDYEYDTAGEELTLTILARPSVGPPCGPSAPADATLVGPSGGALPVTNVLQISGIGGARVPFTFPSAEPYRVCAWLARTADDVAAAAAADAPVRLPRASLTLTATEVGAKAGGADVAVHATGTAEAPADLYVIVVSGSSCPPTYDEQTDPTALDPSPAGLPSRVGGTFDLNFMTRELLSLRAWRICGYLQDGASAAAASATAAVPVDLVLRPALLARPRVTRHGGALVCDGGRWRARPKAALRFAWLAVGRLVGGAHGRRLALGGALRGRRVACRVTARNRLGTAAATSRPVTVR
jgi:hypothetical protein